MKSLKVAVGLMALLMLLFLQWHLMASPVIRKASIRDEMTSTEMFVCGIGKLTPAEVSNLEEWFYRRYSTANWEQARSKQLIDWQAQRDAVRIHAADPPAAQPEDANVSFNTKSGVIHRHNCRYLARCTHCSPTTLAAALSRGGRWCSHCQ